MKTILLSFLFLILFFALRWNSITSPFERDEGEYAYSAQLLRAGKIPYRDSFLQKPPLIIYTYWFGMLLNSNALWPPRVLAAIFCLGTTILLGKIAAKEFGKGAFWPTVFIYTPLIASPINSSLAANTEIFMLLPLVIFLYLFIIRRFHFWAGVAAALAMSYKPICVYVIILIMILWIVKERLKFLLPFVVGGLVTLGVVFFPFGFNGSFKHIWEETVVFNGYYARQWGISLWPFVNNLKVLLRSFWPLYLLFIVFVYIRPKKWKFYLSLILLSTVAVFQTNIRHYLMLLLPFWTLISVSVLLQIKEKKYLPWIVFGVVVAVLVPVAEGIGKSPQSLNLWIYGRENPFYESQLMGTKLAMVTKETDKVFIAGSEPQILFYADRTSLGRFNITYPLIINTPKRLNYQLEAIENFKSALPQAIVYSTKKHSGLWDESTPRDFIDFLTTLINSKYKLVGACVWNKNDVYWVDKLKKDDLKNASLILYKKI